MSERKSKWDTTTTATANSSSPVPSTSTSASDAAAAAAQAAAKIAAQFSAASNPNPPAQSQDQQDSNPKKRPHQDSEAAFQKEIEINDLRNRYMLTKGQNQQQIFQETGASVTTKGTWFPDIALAPPGSKPLYLHVEATTQEMLDQAVAKVEDLIKNGNVPDLNVVDRRTREREMEREDRENERDRRGGARGRHEAKVFIPLTPLPNFNVRAKVVGPGGLFVKYIQSETNTRVQLKGQGSGFLDHESGREGDEAMHVHVSGQDESSVAEGKILALDLLDAVTTEYEKARGFSGNGPRGGSMGNFGPAGNGWGGMGGQGGMRMGGMIPGPPGGGGDLPPPPPEEEQPPPPPAGSSSYNQITSNPTIIPVKVSPTPVPQVDELTKYWNDYITWEKSFKAYHKKLPSKEEGGQDVPPQYR